MKNSLQSSWILQDFKIWNLFRNFKASEPVLGLRKLNSKLQKV